MVCFGRLGSHHEAPLGARTTNFSSNLSCGHSCASSGSCFGTYPLGRTPCASSGSCSGTYHWDALVRFLWVVLRRVSTGTHARASSGSCFGAHPLGRTRPFPLGRASARIHGDALFDLLPPFFAFSSLLHLVPLACMCALPLGCASARIHSDALVRFLWVALRRASTGTPSSCQLPPGRTRERRG